MRAEFGKGDKALKKSHAQAPSPLSPHSPVTPSPLQTPIPSALQFFLLSSLLVFPTHPLLAPYHIPCPTLPLQQGLPQPRSRPPAASPPPSPGPATPAGRLTLMPCSTRTCSRSSSPKETFLPPWLLSLPPIPAARALGTPLPSAPP